MAKQTLAEKRLKLESDLAELIKAEKAEKVKNDLKAKEDKKIRDAQEKEARAKWLVKLGEYAEAFIQGVTDLPVFLQSAEKLSENLKYAGVDYVPFKDSDINFDEAVEVKMAPEIPSAVKQ